MFAVLAAIAFGVAFILKISGAPHYVTDATLIGLFLVALHLAFSWPLPWVRRTP